MSLVLKDWPPLLPLAVPLAVCDVAGEDALVKWPNDVVVRGCAAGAQSGRLGHASAAAAAPLLKLAGVLIEGRPQEGWLVVGIGLNVAVDLDDMPPELRSTAATLGKSKDDVEPTLDRLLLALAHRLSQPAERIVADWRARDALLGATVSFPGGEGTAEGIDDGGRLLVRGVDGVVSALDSGEVILQSSRAYASQTDREGRQG
jgi:BirA family biotin operon repressor/biotin-[acetyl-CoA-carboxylase] ligase